MSSTAPPSSPRSASCRLRLESMEFPHVWDIQDDRIVVCVLRIGDWSDFGVRIGATDLWSRLDRCAEPFITRVR